jgi:hypothetical protein
MINDERRDGPINQTLQPPGAYLGKSPPLEKTE